MANSSHRIKKEPIYVAHIDGSCEPQNPGDKLGIGVVVECGNKIVYEKSKILHRFGTNNEAEYLALEDLMEWKESSNIMNVRVYSDSTLVVNQMNGRWRIKKGTYKKTALRCKKRMKGIKISWVSRNLNTHADMLSKGGEESVTPLNTLKRSFKENTSYDKDFNNVKLNSDDVVKSMIKILKPEHLNTTFTWGQIRDAITLTFEP